MRIRFWQSKLSPIQHVISAEQQTFAGIFPGVGQKWSAAFQKFKQIYMNIATSKMISPESGGKPFSSKLLIASLIVWLVLFAIGLAGYSGSKATYALFSLVTATMLVTGFRQVSSYGYLFLTVFLWLGFWLKATLHTILSYPFVEPVGSFVGGAEAWDDVLHVAIVASLGVMLGKILFDLMTSRITPRRQEIMPVAPPWYAKSRKWLWLAVTFTAAAALLINLKYGVHLIGLAPRTVLMWPLNAIVAWLLNIGLATGIAVLLWWDIALKKNLTIPVYAIIVEALISSVSILSRAVYVFHAIPQLWALHRLKHISLGWSRAKIALLAVFSVVFLVVSISAVTTFRNYLYQSSAYSSTAYQVAVAESEVVVGAIAEVQLKIKNSSPAESQALKIPMRELQAEELKLKLRVIKEKAKSIEAMKSGSAQSKILMNEFGYQITGGFPSLILQLSVDRWIGLEGILAVQSYPKKNMGLLWHALSENPAAGKADTYQVVSNSIYLKSDGTKFRFATLPGAAAFLYYSDSLIIVMLGMVFFSLAVLVVELFIINITANPILCSLYGSVMANNVVQFGVSPRHNLPYFCMLAFGILLVWMIQTNFFTRVLCKLNLFKNAQPRDA